MPQHATTAPQMAPMNLQGIAVPSAMVNDAGFKQLTRRNFRVEGAPKIYNSATSTTDSYQLLKDGILASIMVRFTGTITVSGGSVASTARWPYDMVNFKFTANGQSNLINASGLKLKLREIMKRTDWDDRGTLRTMNGQPVSSGTTSGYSESWGVGSNTSGIGAGTYPVELCWMIPVAEDERDLVGAIFMSTASVDMVLTMDYRPITQLFTGSGTANLQGSFTIAPLKFTIPAANGGLVLPDLSMFHQVIQDANFALGNGANEIRIPGQGAGKSLLRTYYQVWNGLNTAAAPLTQSAANFGEQAWRYGSNETPDSYVDGQLMRERLEHVYNSDIGGAWGVAGHEFAGEGTEFRDVVQEVNTGDLRLVANINQGVALTNPVMEFVTETVFYGGQAA